MIFNLRYFMYLRSWQQVSRIKWSHTKTHKSFAYWNDHYFTKMITQSLKFFLFQRQNFWEISGSATSFAQHSHPDWHTPLRNLYNCVIARGSIRLEIHNYRTNDKAEQRPSVNKPWGQSSVTIDQLLQTSWPPHPLIPHASTIRAII